MEPAGTRHRAWTTRGLCVPDPGVGVLGTLSLFPSLSPRDEIQQCSPWAVFPAWYFPAGLQVLAWEKAQDRM